MAEVASGRGDVRDEQSRDQPKEPSSDMNGSILDSGRQAVEANRLQQLLRALASAALVCLAVVVLPSAASGAPLGAWSFVSASNLKPPQIRVEISRPRAAPG